MLFFFKEKPIELIAYTDNPALAEFFPITQSISALPSYYKTMAYKNPIEVMHPIENIQNYSTTIKSCYGIHQFNKNGYIIPLWGDYSVISTEKISCVASGKNQFFIHDEHQGKGVLDDFHTLKLINPWILKCKQDIDFLGVQNFYAANSLDWCIPPGMYNFKYQSSINTFVLINKKINKEVLFRAGNPLLKLIPLTEKKVSLKIEVVDNVQKYNVAPFNFYFKNGFNLIKKQFNKYGGVKNDIPSR
jgi:hypothetical protein